MPNPFDDDDGDDLVCVRPPEHFSLAAREHWETLVSALAGRDFWVGDASKLIAACECWGRYREATDRLAAEGLVLSTVRGVVKNPLCTIANQSLQQYLKLRASLDI